MVTFFSYYHFISVSVHTVNISTSGSPVAGQMYTLTCTRRIVGNTSLTPVVTWSNSNGVVTSGNGITVSNGNLTFNPLHTSHGGQYICQSTLSRSITSMMNIIVKSMTSRLAIIYSGHSMLTPFPSPSSHCHHHLHTHHYLILCWYTTQPHLHCSAHPTSGHSCHL